MLLRVGDLSNQRAIEIAIRDMEKAIQELQNIGRGVPTSTQLLVRSEDGTYNVWDLVSTGGCTITKDAALKRITIHVP